MSSALLCKARDGNLPRRLTLGVRAALDSGCSDSTGVYGTSASGYAVYDNGNAWQANDKGGLVKAMIAVRADGTVARCYNSQRQDGGAGLPPSGTSGCGFSVVHLFHIEHDNSTTATTYVDFNFQVDDRFWSATGGASFENVGITARISEVDEIAVKMFLTDERTETSVFRDFILIVY